MVGVALSVSSFFWLVLVRFASPFGPSFSGPFSSSNFHNELCDFDQLAKGIRQLLLCLVNIHLMSVYWSCAIFNESINPVLLRKSIER